MGFRTRRSVDRAAAPASICDQNDSQALVVRVLESFDAAVALPKLYVVAVHELLGVFFGSVVIGQTNPTARIKRPSLPIIYARYSAMAGPFPAGNLTLATTLP